MVRPLPKYAQRLRSIAAVFPDVCAGFPVVGTGPSSLGNTGPGGFARTDGNRNSVFGSMQVSVFSDAGTTPSVNGGAVQQWNDQSGYANHATTVAGQPTYDATDPSINNFHR
ncbi:MAG: hypothetical protein IPJ20_15265 [Flammeovirgaceae bacterium]|nr:hypothetical protein [Flammeovirgaceae bacterium]